jgi:hypothetical protein
MRWKKGALSFLLWLLGQGWVQPNSAAAKRQEWDEGLEEPVPTTARGTRKEMVPRPEAGEEGCFIYVLGDVAVV